MMVQSMLRKVATVAASMAIMAQAGGLKSVIVLIPDGCGQSIQTLSRWYKGDALTVDKMNSGVAKTHMANSIITGSAAAGTAFATGFKTTVRFLSIGPRASDTLTGFTMPMDASEWSYRPIATVLEAAKLEGKSVGLISTSRITHATPAAFGCHIQDRGWDNDIMEHLVYQNIDVVMGGGRRHLLPKSMGGKRTDGENLEDVLKARGYEIVYTRDEMASCSSDKVWGMFAMSHMDAEIDRPIYNPEEPSLSEMTAKAISILSQNPRGFFLMVESSQVDWAGHNNDPVYMVTDFLEFDKCVEIANNYVDSDPTAAVLAYPDHNCGGMDIGNYGSPYTSMSIESVIDGLKGMDRTCCSVVDEAEAMGGTDGDLVSAFQDYWNVSLTPEDITEIRALESNRGLCYAAARVISKNHTYIGWTSHGHNAEDVPVWTYGKKRLHGLVDNTDLAKAIFNVWHVNVPELNGRLFVDIETTPLAPFFALDTSDPENPVLKGTGGNVHVEMPVSKDVMKVTVRGVTTEYQLEGLVVYAPETNRTYVPGQAIEMIRRILSRS